MGLVTNYINEMREMGLTPGHLREPDRASDKQAIAEIQAVAEQAIYDLDRYFGSGPHAKYAVVALQSIADHAARTLDVLETPAA